MLADNLMARKLMIFLDLLDNQALLLPVLQHPLMDVILGDPPTRYPPRLNALPHR